MDKSPDRQALRSSSNVLSTPVSNRKLRKSESGPVSSEDSNRSQDRTKSLRKLSSFTSPARNAHSAQKRSYSSGDCSPPSESPPSEPYLIPITPSRDSSPAGSKDTSPARAYRLPESEHSLAHASSAAYQNATLPQQYAQSAHMTVPTGISIMASNKMPPPPGSIPNGVYPPPSSQPGNGSGVNVPPPSSQNHYQAYQPYSSQSLSPDLRPAQEKLPTGMSPAPPNQSAPPLRMPPLRHSPPQQQYPPPPSRYSPPNTTTSLPHATAHQQPTYAYAPPPSSIHTTQPSAPHLRPHVPTLSTVGPPPVPVQGTRSTGSASGSASPSRRRQQQQQQALQTSNPPSYTSAPGGTVPKKKSRSPPRSRIDTNQMPRPNPVPTNSPATLYYTKSSTNSRKVPPASTANFTSVDSGNASPRAMRVTTVAPPSTKSLAGKTALPLAVVSTPFAMAEYEEVDVPLVDMKQFGSTEGNPPRCGKCRGYINPNVTWSQGGAKWECNLCGASNNTEAW
jgi:protein transport protein SEC24